MDFNNKIVIIDKPKNISSAFCLNLFKKRFNIKKAGHNGTLDPLASGVLVVATNKRTKELSQLNQDDKQYLVKLKFNTHTDSYDRLGKVIRTTNYVPEIKQLNDYLTSLDNHSFYQLPPNFSALKVNGVRAYQLARKAVDFELEKRPTTIYKAKLISYYDDYAEILLDVKKGFYVRSFVVDLASQFNTTAMMVDLVRTRSGQYSLKDVIDYQFNK
ncbi:tRNA pseudouridine synthase B [Mycoplasmoides gallisepticum CA06_2006.052-5-2P]|uniref:tRNA pseudouridine synthase B n=3 Tax=Mycoplasmoides gallisepticum TaxID=2096 RepID=TRUB_MYCGA|nr:tRNA pseudouridine(55) synthase TruB [Mycoplasmoides gallisepticum]P59879.2 RecName: Full=tRNA pseudouridine synthase B; AltName: Full=tRNA pseudouridine(55) synthase; Short=Psi55 synthase; AltName: Full=tRNA pseudouridylate synthase; AltName: Full=tRNA-uridine isomerase [Mycoplasmoides gallisepticum str. R(low)]AAP56469.2 tRNA pseudouridine synthase B [Mycoplasmoides gallisepticum str. R(low)]ADC30301.1 tRNA pseudouridine synthase B [Mycoplasmoides gallisepticum str. R(high)]ADC31065.1 tRNA